jgi:hypothetical protein
LSRVLWLISTDCYGSLTVFKPRVMAICWSLHGSYSTLVDFIRILWQFGGFQSGIIAAVWNSSGFVVIWWILTECYNCFLYLSRVLIATRKTRNSITAMQKICITVLLILPTRITMLYGSTVDIQTTIVAVLQIFNEVYHSTVTTQTACSNFIITIQTKCIASL